MKRTNRFSDASKFQYPIGRDNIFQFRQINIFIAIRGQMVVKKIFSPNDTKYKEMRKRLIAPGAACILRFYRNMQMLLNF